MDNFTNPNWPEGILVGFDTETTGVSESNDRIVTASIVIVDENGTLVKSLDWVINPGIDIPEESTLIHGVTNEYVQEHGMHPIDALNQICSTLHQVQEKGAPIITFNGKYDFSILAFECMRYDLPVFQPTVTIDAYVLQKQFNKYFKGKKKLTNLCHAYGIDLENAHNASSDAYASVLLARYFHETYPGTRVPSHQLHTSSIRWAGMQAASLEEYFRRTDPTARVDGGWPLTNEAQQAISEYQQN